MTGFEVEQASLPTTREAVAQVSGQLERGIADINTTITDLLDDGWSGQASTAFRAGFEEWLTGARQVLAALRSADDALDDTATAYRQRDDASADLMKRLGGNT